MSKTFGQLVASLRQERGLSVYALAQQAGLSGQAIHDLESSDRQPALDTARRLAKALGVSLDVMVSQLPEVELPDAVPARPRGRPPKLREGCSSIEKPKRPKGRANKGG